MLNLQYAHVLGQNNRMADLLSRWQNSPSNLVKHKCLVPDAIWLNIDIKELELNVNLYWCLVDTTLGVVKAALCQDLRVCVRSRFHTAFLPRPGNATAICSEFLFSL